MPKPSPQPTRRRRSSRGRRRRPVRREAAARVAALEEPERGLLACYCPPGARLLALGSGATAQAIAAARLGYRVTAVELPPCSAAPKPRPADVPGLEWLRTASLVLPVESGAFAAAIVLGRGLEELPTRAMRSALLREAARAVGPGGHVIVGARNDGARPGWRQWLWDAAKRRAERSGGWQRLEPATTGPVAVASAAYPAPALVRDAAVAGLRVAAELAWPASPPGALATLARRGAARWYAALEVA